MFYSAGRLALASYKNAKALHMTFFDGACNDFWMKRELKFIFTYMMSCHPDKYSLLAQVGDGNACAPPPSRL